MHNLLMVLGEAGNAADSGDGSGVIGFFVIVGFLWAICAACNRKKEYDVYMKGKIKQR